MFVECLHRLGSRSANVTSKVFSINIAIFLSYEYTTSMPSPRFPTWVIQPELSGGVAAAGKATRKKILSYEKPNLKGQDTQD
jgi:hypothetical protein